MEERSGSFDTDGMNKRMEGQYKFNISVDAREGWIEGWERVIEMVMRRVLSFLRRKFKT